MKRLVMLGIALGLAACGANTEQRSATGAGGGAVAGALVGGPVGAVVGAAAGGAGGAGVSAAEKSGKRGGRTQMCVRLNDIDSTYAVDSRTVLLTMRGNSFKRMDLTSSCPGLTMDGFRHSTSTNDLCTTDPLRVNQPVGATCMIKQIVDITPAEAEALRKR
jgi:hypothetical protein